MSWSHLLFLLTLSVEHIIMIVGSTMFLFWHLIDAPLCPCFVEYNETRLSPAEPSREVVCPRRQQNLTYANHTPPGSKTTTCEGRRERERVGERAPKVAPCDEMPPSYPTTNHGRQQCWRRNQKLTLHKKKQAKRGFVITTEEVGNFEPEGPTPHSDRPRTSSYPTRTWRERFCVRDLASCCWWVD